MLLLEKVEKKYRVFTGINIPLECRFSIQNFQKQIQEDIESKDIFPRNIISWQPMEMLHITLHFAGEMAENTLELAKKKISKVAGCTSPFPVDLSGLDYFSYEDDTPQVLWIPIATPQPFQDLNSLLVKELSGYGNAVSRWEYKPHMTFGRLTEKLSEGQMQELIGIFQKTRGITQFTASSIAVMCSEKFGTGCSTFYQELGYFPFKGMYDSYRNLRVGKTLLMENIGKTLKVLEVKKYPKYKYEVRRELVDSSFFMGKDSEPFEMETAYTDKGGYIGSPKRANFLCKDMGIYPETIPTWNVCSIGYCEKDKKWYGWSHRAMFGFGVGDVVKKGDSCAGAGPLGADFPESLPVGFKAKTTDDAKKMAIAFANSVA